MPPETFQYIVVFVPLLVIILLALFFYRLFTKASKKDKEYSDKLKELDGLRRIAEFKSARIVSVQPYQTSHYSPGLKTVQIRFEVEEAAGKFKILSAVWQMDDYFSSNYQAGDDVQVKVYDEYVFASDDRIKLLP